MIPVNIKDKFSLFSEYWTPKIIGSCNGQLIKIAKAKGEFVWHSHELEDEVFILIKGEFIIDFRDGSSVMKEGDMLVVPRGVEHRPRTAAGEAWVMLMEPETTRHTGNVISEITVDKPEWI